MLLLVLTVLIIFLGFNDNETPVYSYEVIASYPHDSNAFTQGLLYHADSLCESTGLYGESSLREVNLTDGKVLRQIDLDSRYFGEGITVMGDKIFMLTWLEHQGFVYDLNTFTLIDQFHYPTEGWGLTSNEEFLIMSDGSSKLSFLDPDSLQVIKQVTVTDQDQPIDKINELEFIDGLIYANIWQTDLIAIIQPESGQVHAWIDLTGILDQDPHLTTYNQKVDVLNGIAYDSKNNRLFVTGKLWPRLYQIDLIK